MVKWFLIFSCVVVSWIRISVCEWSVYLSHFKFCKMHMNPQESNFHGFFSFFSYDVIWKFTCDSLAGINTAVEVIFSFFVKSWHESLSYKNRFISIRLCLFLGLFPLDSVNSQVYSQKTWFIPKISIYSPNTRLKVRLKQCFFYSLQIYN